MDHLMMIKRFLAVFLILQAASETAVSATVYTVGDNMGWEIPINNSTFYSEWVNTKTFSVGDALVFNWTGTHDVANVTEDVYSKCSISAVSSNQILSNSSGYTYNITSNGSYYFICTVGSHCSLGQKLSIKIGEQSGESPTSPAPSSSFSVLPPILSYALFLIYFLGYI